MMLSEITAGKAFEVVAIGSDCSHAGRLSSLGFLPGSRVSLAHVAPLGDPIAIEMKGQEISVRLSEARLVEVREVE